MADNLLDQAKKSPLVPHHEIKEIFADQVGTLYFDGSTLKIDFTVIRVSEPTPQNPAIGERHVVARLALSTSGTLDLINQVKGLTAQLSQSGLIKTDQGRIAAEKTMPKT